MKEKIRELLKKNLFWKLIVGKLYGGEEPSFVVRPELFECIYNIDTKTLFVVGHLDEYPKWPKDVPSMKASQANYKEKEIEDEVEVSELPEIMGDNYLYDYLESEQVIKFIEKNY